MTIPVVLYLLLSCITALVVPWIGIVLYYVQAVGKPAAMWPEHFGQNSRVSFYMSLAIIAGLGIATATRQVDWRRLFVLPSLGLIFMVVAFNISIAYSPFAEFVDVKLATLTSAEILDIFNKIMIVFFIGVLLIDTRFKLVTFIYVIAAVLMYYVYWANKIYITGEFWRFGDNGRLNGPWGVYHDENYLAMLYVLAVPVFYYLSVGTTYRVIRYGLWAAIPLAWHALFLTGSRGALLALSVTMLYIFFRSYSKKASIVLFVGLVVAIATQSGNMISRVTDTASIEESERDRAFIENTDDSPEINTQKIDPRLISWEVGLKIMADYPLFGVGAANFMRAFPQYDESEPHVAHNTFIQIGAASGAGAAFVYLYILFLRLKNMAQKPDSEKENPHGHVRDYLDDLITSVTISFYIVALFLDLMIIEVTYFIFLVGISKYCLEKRKKRTIKSLIASIYRWKDPAKDESVETVSVADPGAAPMAPAPIYANGFTRGAFEAAAEPEEVIEVIEEAPRNLYARVGYSK